MKKLNSFYYVRAIYNQLWEAKKYHKYKTEKLEKLEEHLVFIKSLTVKSLGITLFNKEYKKRIKEKIRKTKTQIKRKKDSIRFINSKIKFFNDFTTLG